MTARFFPKARAPLFTTLVLLLAFLWVLPFGYLIFRESLQALRWMLEYHNGSIKGVLGDLRWYYFSSESWLWWVQGLEFRWYLNSLGTSVAITGLTILLAAPCAYAFSRLEFPGKKVLFWVLMAGIMIPKEVLLVPLYILMYDVSWLNTYQGITLPQVVAPLAIFVFKQYFDRVSEELRDAAYIDGAGELRILWSIYMPLNRNVTLALGVYLFITAWNNFFWPFLVTYSEELFTLPVALGTDGFSFNLMGSLLFFLALGLVVQTLFFNTGVLKLGVNRTSLRVNYKRLAVLTASLAGVVSVIWLGLTVVSQAKAVQPLETPLETRWAKGVTPDNVLAEYPRPQLEREDWLNLNGTWNYALTSTRSKQPRSFDKQILVPFPIESKLSGVALRANDRRLWYQRTFEVPDAWQDKRVMLHFGAVDYEASVWVNGQELGTHKGGYDEFSFDITDVLTATGEQEIVVSVVDPSDSSTQPRGKQVREPGGIWYTSTTGIWQTVWLEPVAESHVETLKIETDINSGTLHLTAGGQGSGGAGEKISVVVLDEGNIVVEGVGNLNETLSLKIPNAKLWSPKSPFLYDLKIELSENDKVVDEVSSYFGMRKISLGKDEAGFVKLFLNNKPLFQYGLLDQGFWPDGLYTAPTDEALRYDLEMVKRLGFNMVRKHVKVEPQRWYYWADKLGVLVWQDMPSGDAFVDNGAGEIKRSEASAAQFEAELKEMVDEHINHPAIVMWVIFNEGWGQYDTVRLTNWLKDYDKTRLVNAASGWNDMKIGDVRDIHSYPGPNAPQVYPDRASVLGEFGGLGLAIQGLTWQDEANWGYQELGDQQILLDEYTKLVNRLRPLIVEQGLAAAIYTQLSDVEVEVNGMMTYDRALAKIEPVTVKWINRILYEPPPVNSTILPTSEKVETTWRYTLEQPTEDWIRSDFDDSSWQEGKAGFGTTEANVTVGTPWSSKDIWLRSSFTLEDTFLKNPYVRVFHDEDLEVYINGELVSKLPYYTFEYVNVALKEEAKNVFRKGLNTIAVHCKNTIQTQYCDVGIFDTSETLGGQ
jgi:ABC-type glycerol-3-phosphate transport system permease component